jgi:hypothetical protein
MAFSKGGGWGMGRRSFGGFFSSSIIHFFWHCGIWIGKLHVCMPTNPLREDRWRFCASLKNLNFLLKKPKKDRKQTLKD